MDDVQWRFSHGNKVEAKYCPIEIDGDVKYYICPRNEVCCTFGCCISSNFHFYQLWYYWLMVILMFLLCSGGTWWYRYWLQEGHFHHHTPPPSHRPVPRHRPSPARVAYHAGRNTVVVQQIWKPQRNGPMGYPTPPPSYSLVQNTAATVDQSGASGVSNIPTQMSKLKPSPYYQLYGPPPSYDSVITESLSERRHNDNHTASCEQPHNDSCDTSATRSRPLDTHDTGSQRSLDTRMPDAHSSSVTQCSSRSHKCESDMALPK